MEVKPGKVEPKKYLQGRAHNAEINKHGYFKILSRLPTFFLYPTKYGSFSCFVSSCFFFSLFTALEPLLSL